MFVSKLKLKSRFVRDNDLSFAFFFLGQKFVIHSEQQNTW